MRTTVESAEENAEAATSKHRVDSAQPVTALAQQDEDDGQYANNGNGTVDTTLERWSPEDPDGAQLAGSLFPGRGGGMFVHGVVHGPGGDPVSGAMLTLTDSGGRQIDRASSDEEGGFRVHPGSGGTYILIASAGQFQPSASMVAVNDRPVRRDVELSGAGVLVGMVHAGTKPVPGAMVVLTDVRGEVVASGATGSGGGYRLPDLLGGSYTLTVSAEGHRPVATQTSVPEGEETTVDIPLEAGTRLTGVVRSANLGVPVPEAQVSLLDSTGGVVSAMTTDAEGGYEFTDLPEGEYTVIATGYPPVASSLHLDGQEAVHDVALGHSGAG